MNVRQAIGKRIRELRERGKLSQGSLADQGGITYQYLSSLENGRENVTIGVLESLAAALKTGLPDLLGMSRPDGGIEACPVIDPRYLRKQVPLPGPMTWEGLERALNETQRIVAQINQNLVRSGARILQSYIQGNNFSGLVSNLLCDSLSSFAGFSHNSHQAYPDLIARVPGKRGVVGLEVKATINIGKGGESHNGHSGPHLVACFKVDQESGNILFIHVMIANLRGHKVSSPDWKYLGSRENPETGSRRTETYTTNLQGTTKLRDGSVYLDPGFVDYSRWRQPVRKRMPSYSIYR